MSQLARTPNGDDGENLRNGMTAAETLDALREIGVRVRLADGGENVKYAPASATPPELVEAIRANKPGIKRMLSAAAAHEPDRGIGRGGGLRAIETVYNGYRFRSRLEARWAVFFDSLNIRYEYEPEGYDLGEAGWYLPDFWLPEHKCWVEAKASHPSAEEEKKACYLARGSGFTVVVFGGRDFAPYDWDESTGMFGHSYTPENDYDGSDDGVAHWRDCLDYGLVLVNHPSPGRPGCCAVVSPHLRRAYAAARQARFEHGETPQPLRGR